MMGHGKYESICLKGVRVVPQEDRLLVLPDESANKTEGGIVLPDTARGRPTQGIVVAAGPGRYDNNGNLIPMPYEAGDRVIYAAFSETGLQIDGVEHLLLKQQDIYGKVESVEVEETVGT